MARSYFPRVGGEAPRGPLTEDAIRDALRAGVIGDAAEMADTADGPYTPVRDALALALADAMRPKSRARDRRRRPWPPSTYTASADVFGVGALMYAMLTGRAPFPGSNPPEITGAMTKGAEPLSLPRSDARYDAIAGVVMRAIANDPKERFTTATEMRQALTAARG